MTQYRKVGLYGPDSRPVSFTGTKDEMLGLPGNRNGWRVIFGYGPVGPGFPLVDSEKSLYEAMQYLAAHVEDGCVITAEGLEWAREQGLMMREQQASIGPRKLPRVKLAQEFVREIEPAELAMRAWSATQDLCG